MTRRLAAAVLCIACASGALAAGQAKPPAPSVDEIAAKNAAARGGLDAWRRVRAMSWVGHIESAHAPTPNVQFVLQQERPDKTRFEVNAMGERTVRVFDGLRGWKVRSGHDGRPQVRPFTIGEVRYAQAAQVIDGPLLDHAAKGIDVALEGVDEIDGHRSYRLALTQPSGAQDHLWVDATTFLDVRYDRALPAGPDGAVRAVSTRYRDYKDFDGLQIASIIETGANAEPGNAPDRMVVEKVVINPSLDKRTFADPSAPRGRNAAPYTPRRPAQARAPVVPAGPALPAEQDAGSAPR